MNQTNPFTALLSSIISPGDTKSFPKFRLFMMDLAYNSVRVVFSSKMGYDLWKLKKEMDEIEQKIAILDEASARNRTHDAAVLDESKLYESDDERFDGGVLARELEEEKSDQFDLEERIRELSEQRLNALRCCTIAAGFNIWSEILGSVALEPSAQLLLASFFALVWNANPKILLHFHDHAYSAIVAKFDAWFKPAAALFAKHAALKVADLSRMVYIQLGSLMDWQSLEELQVKLEESITVVKEKTMKRSYEELKAAAIEQQNTSRDIMTMAKTKKHRKAPRQSSVF